MIHRCPNAPPTITCRQDPRYSTPRIYPVTPDLAKARAPAKGRATTTAVLYTCDQAPCDQQAQIIKADLRAIGIEVQMKAFQTDTLFAKYVTPGEPFDIGYVAFSARLSGPR